MGLKVCALCSSETKQDKERAATGSWLCALCASKKKWDTEGVGMGFKVCALCASELNRVKERVVFVT